jgi:hypothetical protein
MPHTTDIATGIPSDIGVEAAATLVVAQILDQIVRGANDARGRGVREANLAPVLELVSAIKTEEAAIAAAVAANEEA